MHGNQPALTVHSFFMCIPVVLCWFFLNCNPACGFLNLWCNQYERWLKVLYCDLFFVFSQIQSCICYFLQVCRCISELCRQRFSNSDSMISECKARSDIPNPVVKSVAIDDKLSFWFPFPLYNNDVTIWMVHVFRSFLLAWWCFCMIL